MKILFLKKVSANFGFGSFGENNNNININININMSKVVTVTQWYHRIQNIMIFSNQGAGL